MSELTGYALQSGGQDRPRALNPCGPALNISPKICQAIFPTNRNRREKTGLQNFAEGLSMLIVVPTVTDDATGASGATDIRPRAGSIGSASSLRDSNKVSGQPGLLNAEAFIRFGSSWCQSNQSDSCQSQ